MRTMIVMIYLSKSRATTSWCNVTILIILTTTTNILTHNIWYNFVFKDSSEKTEVLCSQNNKGSFKTGKLYLSKYRDRQHSSGSVYCLSPVSVCVTKPTLVVVTQPLTWGQNPCLGSSTMSQTAPEWNKSTWLLTTSVKHSHTLNIIGIRKFCKRRQIIRYYNMIITIVFIL